jgi:vacuolar-type H+-ATPase subunit E/Vma4
MRWTDGPQRWHRLQTVLYRLEQLVDACARAGDCDEQERERIEKQYERLYDRIVEEAEREHQRLINAANQALN